MQGLAFRDIPEGTYYAAASLFNKPKPNMPATVTFNVGPDFAHVTPTPEGFPPAQPLCEAAAAAAAAIGQHDGGTVLVAPPPEDTQGAALDPAGAAGPSGAC